MSSAAEKIAVGAKMAEVSKTLKSVDTSAVEVDDEQSPPTIAAHSDEEKRLLGEMCAILAPAHMSAEEAAAVPKDILLMCLRGRKYNIEKGAVAVPKMLKLISENDLDSPDEKLTSDLLSQKFVTTGGKDHMGRAIVLVRLRYHDKSGSTARAARRLVGRILLHTLRGDPDVQRCGLAILHDMTGLGLKNLDPALFKAIIGEVLPGLPIRVGRICIFNPPWFVSKVIFPVFRMLIAPKLRARIAKVDGDDPEKLLPYFPKSGLAEMHGGTIAFDHVAWAARVDPKGKN